MIVNEQRWSKKKVLDYLTDNPGCVFVTNNETRLGAFGAELGLPTIDNGGCFAFWIKPEKLKKYIGGC